MKALITIFCTLFLLSCSVSRHICIDLEDYVGLDDKDVHFQMIIDNPNEPNSADTVYWQGSKKFKYELKETPDDYLAFVEVSKLDEDDLEHRLFRSVAAIDGDNITIRVLKRDSVILSGSKSNECITNFWHGKILEGQIINDYKDIICFCQNEIKNHPNDLYGAFIYSFEFIHQYRHIDESISPAIKAEMILDEIKHSDSYIYNHSVVRPFLDTIISAGDVSMTLKMAFISYMIPF